MNRLASTIYASTDTPLGNGAFTASGQLVVSHHPMYETPHRVSIFEADGSLSPFPNLAWNTPGDEPMAYLDAVLGLHDDSQGRIWLADMGTRSQIQPKLVVWDTRADALWRVIPLPPEVTTPFSEPNDFVVDEVRGKVYIADEGAGGGGDGSRAALIVVDIETGTAERRLEGAEGIMAERRPLVIDGKRIERNELDGSRTALHVGVDGIVMDRAGRWLYLSPLNGHSLWRLQVADLLDPALDDAALAARLERYADKPNSGGMCMDEDDNVYLTVIETNAIGRVSSIDRSYDEPVKRDDMFWPDGLMRGPDGAIYCVCTQLPRSPALARPGDRLDLPFKVFRFDPRPAELPGVAARAAAGALAGIVSSAAVMVFQSAWGLTKLPPAPDGLVSPPEKVAVIVSQAAGHRLGPSEARVGGTVVHFATGVGLGALYGVLSDRWPAVRRGGGTLYGLGVWTIVGETGLALAGLKPPPWRIDAARHGLEAMSHIVFGITLEAALTRILPKRM
ncbi:DUF1440 domain-containing protein [Sphingosinicellaceae bacterium]|nr:DUF1440 domain-containing protein [Sphingosinicellaceae bacterium]